LHVSGRVDLLLRYHPQLARWRSAAKSPSNDLSSKGPPRAYRRGIPLDSVTNRAKNINGIVADGGAARDFLGDRRSSGGNRGWIGPTVSATTSVLGRVLPVFYDRHRLEGTANCQLRRGRSWSGRSLMEIIGRVRRTSFYLQGFGGLRGKLHCAAKDAYYEYDGKLLQAAILDRRCELSSRTGLSKASLHWDVKCNSLDYTRNNDAVNLTVVRRKNEPPTDSGFGSDEVYRILSSAGGVFGGATVYRAARVRRRYRRGYDEVTGKRTVDCIEIVTTHRVLDGIAGLEFPTSTYKTRMRYTQL